jgi:hypothetical protein
MYLKRLSKQFVVKLSYYTFGSTFICEQVFFTTKTNKSKSWSHITNEHFDRHLSKFDKIRT